MSFHNIDLESSVLNSSKTVNPMLNFIEGSINSIKLLAATLVCTFASYVDPLKNAFTVLLLLAGADIFFGLLAGITRQNDKMSIRKFLKALAQIALYLFVITLIYVVGWFQGDADEALAIVKTITYVFIYFLGGNLLKNLSRLFPSNEALMFLHKFFTLEFAKRIPGIANTGKNKTT